MAATRGSVEGSCDLDVIEKVGWDASEWIGLVSKPIPAPVPGVHPSSELAPGAAVAGSELRIAPLYVWLRGESVGAGRLRVTSTVAVGCKKPHEP